MTSYAYVQCKPNGVPFYVGKGTKCRAKNLGERNAHHRNIVRKYGHTNILVGMLECSTEKIAYELEIGIIKCLRAMQIDLTNRTSGGEGGSNPCAETRLKLSAAAKKRGVSEKCALAKVAKLKGKPLTAIHKDRLSKALSGRAFSDSHRMNISISAKKRGISEATRQAAKAACTGKKPSEELKSRRGAAIRAKLEQSNRTVKVKLNGVDYISIAEASRALAISSAAISRALQNSGYVKGLKVERIK